MTDGLAELKAKLEHALPEWAKKELKKMTLARGDKVIKLNKETGEPLTTEEEGHIEYEVFDLGSYLSLIRPGAPNEETAVPEVFLSVLLRKLH